jgi:hypothetical protein
MEFRAQRNNNIEGDGETQVDKDPSRVRDEAQLMAGEEGHKTWGKHGRASGAE